MINYMAPDSRCACNRGDDPVLRRPERKARKSEVRRGGELFRSRRSPRNTTYGYSPKMAPLSPRASPSPSFFKRQRMCTLTAPPPSPRPKALNVRDLTGQDQKLRGKSIHRFKVPSLCSYKVEAPSLGYCSPSSRGAGEGARAGEGGEGGGGGAEEDTHGRRKVKKHRVGGGVGVRCEGGPMAAAHTAAARCSPRSLYHCHFYGKIHIS